ncbi:MAG: PKHD-type hydroxylase, partial [Microcoleus sp. SIO2G3]|nr:PKHD-type hydroxylase [Microcoleus sp. SIO2G3]
VRDSSLREVLFDLDTVRRALFQQYGKSIEFDLLSKTHANLLRKWVE